MNGSLQTIGSLADLKRNHADYVIMIKRKEGGASKAKINKVVSFVFPEAVMDQKNAKFDEVIFRVINLIEIIFFC